MFTKLLDLFIVPTISVEAIHEEFDTAQDRILDECDKMLKELEIPTETSIERKGKILKELGFINSKTVQQADKLKKDKEVIKDKISITSEQAKTIRYYKEKYPLEKFITVEELERICSKYKLIHAPVANYIEDIPEKNVLEMKNVKRLEDTDKFPTQHFLKITDFYYSVPNEVKKYFQDSICLNNYVEGKKIIKYESGGISESSCQRLLKELGYMGSYTGYLYKRTEITLVNKSGLFIAAPSSHFNLEGLSKKSKFGFFDVSVIEVKDPIVFEYCKLGICRIISKWGTADDKSYLDSTLVNEKFN